MTDSSKPGPLRPFSPLKQLEFNALDLVRKYPPRLIHPNKKAVYDSACPQGSVHNGHLRITQWPEFKLPNHFAPFNLQVEIKAGFYDYEAIDADAMEWHVNFADGNLFFGYGGGLFAQDEIQVAEHPSLGSVREALLPEGWAQTIVNKRPRPVLVAGVERRCFVQTRPMPEVGLNEGLYGSNFGNAATDAVRSATTRINPPTISNIIAIAAEGYHNGRYTKAQIEYVLTTAYTGFSAAVEESRLSGTFAIIHTGWWGCGAFGGNRNLMALLQFLAADAAGVEGLVFHAGEKNSIPFVDHARSFAADLLKAGVSCDSLIHEIAARNYQWGVTDGN